MEHIGEIEKRLWSSADNLRANSPFASNEYFLPVTYYEDPHELLGQCDFVMANPPFNVDEVDAEKVKNDPRLPYALPGVNKKGKVSNGNYLWISYFDSYLTTPAGPGSSCPRRRRRRAARKRRCAAS